MTMLLVHELHEARDRVLLLKERLHEARQRELPAYVPFLDEQARLLDESLAQAEIPDCYRVAIVGPFNVGKSAFLNKLLGERLAAVATNPETAAISVFRYDPHARAEVEFVGEKEWNELAEEHDADRDRDSTNGRDNRYCGFMGFNDRSPKRDKDGNETPRERIDLDALACEYVQAGGKRHTIVAQDWQSKDGKREFLNEIRKFTSAQGPLHYLVNRVTIYAPIPVLRDHIELIDTPGLEDTDRFRVFLTESLVQDVDAVLFLTPSNAAFSQNDKDFVIRQLRRQQIKHLQFVVTKCDETFENAVRDARDNDEEPPTYEDFCTDLENRVKAQAKLTLDELLQINEGSEEDRSYYMDQLDEVPVGVISTKYHEENGGEKSGIEAVRDRLFHILSTSRRFSRSRNTLSNQLDLVLNRLHTSYAERLSTLEKEFNPARVNEEIKEISQSLDAQLNVFQRSLAEAQNSLERDQEAFLHTLPDHLDFVTRQAAGVLSDMRREDGARSPRALSHGHWAYLPNFQARIADRVFPRVEMVLNTLRGHLNTFIEDAKKRMTVLQSRAKQIEEEHYLGGLQPMPLAASLASSLDVLSQNIQCSIEGDRDRIVTSLDDFVTPKVRELVEKARKNVASIIVKGVAGRAGQLAEIHAFYETVRKLLVEALRKHLESRIGEFAKEIRKIAEVDVSALVRKVSEEVIQQRLDAIASARQVANDGKRQKALTFLSEMVVLFGNSGAEPSALAENAPSNGLVIDQQEASLTEVSTSCLREEHYEIAEGATGYTYERIFRPYMDGATEITVEDPYIRSNHQVANFTRFCALALRVGSVKSIELITGQRFNEPTDDADSRLETLKRDLLSRNVILKWSRKDGLHDREIRFNNGWSIKIGRGLDIYQKPENWVSVEAEDYCLRRCRQTKIDIFRGSTVE